MSPMDVYQILQNENKSVAFPLAGLVFWESKSHMRKVVRGVSINWDRKCCSVLSGIERYFEL
jgi:hypothetical protein